MALPPQLKAIQHYLRTAQEHEKRDPVVAYYCRLYAMQTGMKLDSKTPECRKFLVQLMDQLETMKKELTDNDSISQEVVGNAHIENYALKMFLYADNEDRSGRFHKNMIKSFYTSSLLLDVLSVFGELSEENIQHRKYARWKATYIHNCLKSGETPQAGPDGYEEETYDEEYGAEGGGGPSYQSSQPAQPQSPPHSQPGFGDPDQGVRGPWGVPPTPPPTTTTSTSLLEPTVQLTHLQESPLNQCLFPEAFRMYLSFSIITRLKGTPNSLSRQVTCASRQRTTPGLRSTASTLAAPCSMKTWARRCKICRRPSTY
uniref:Vta1/callose synthase N-terminal domain-containing protein n=1 Tax=Oncorhynchus tshawytscha TaxID=74940 RepID=A0A8C8GUV0_ONCTS